MSDAVIEEIKERIKISDIISKKVKLSSKGNRVNGLCPFHHEKTPSFYVNDQKGIYYCFGCKASGDVFTFLEQYDKLNFQEALEYLGSLAGIEVKKESKKIIAQKEQANNLYQCNEFALRLFKKELHNADNISALNYIKSRIQDDSLIENFELGFAPLGNRIISELSCKFSEETLLEAGLAYKREGNLSCYFRSRIIFPIRNAKNKIVGFSGRSLDGSNPKYLNTKETIIFKKSKVLYNEYQAFEEAKKNNAIIIVEGFTDVITLTKKGFKASLATMGTAFTEDHLNSIWHICEEPIICMDGDTAGIESMIKIAKLALSNYSPGKNIKFCSLPDKLDPDSYFEAHSGTDFKKQINNSQGISDFIWQYEYSKIEDNSPESVRKLSNKLKEYYNLIVEKNFRQLFGNYFSSKLKSLYSPSKQQTKISHHKNLPKILEHDIIIENSIINFINSYLFLLKNNKILDEFVNFEFRDPENLRKQQDFLKNFASNTAEDENLKQDLEKRWDVIMLNHQIFQMKEEYKILVGKLDQISYNKALELKKQIYSVEQNIKNLESEIYQ